MTTTTTATTTAITKKTTNVCDCIKICSSCLSTTTNCSSNSNSNNFYNNHDCYYIFGFMCACVILWLFDCDCMIFVLAYFCLQQQQQQQQQHQQHKLCNNESISSTFYVRIFRTNVVWQLFSSYMHVEKAAKTTFVHKMLMKLTQRRINIFTSTWSRFRDRYEVNLSINTEILKFCYLICLLVFCQVGYYCGQFHQPFTFKFYVRTSFW